VKAEKRKRTITDIVALAPGRLASNMQANLEKLSDEELEGAYHKSLKAKEYVVALGTIKARSDTTMITHLERRRELYARLAAIRPTAALTPASASSAKNQLPAASSIAPGQSSDAVPLVLQSTSDAAPVKALDLWTSRIESRTEQSVEQLRSAMRLWFMTEEHQALARQPGKSGLAELLDSPLRPEIDHFLTLSLDHIGHDLMRMLRNRLSHSLKSKDDIRAEALLQLLARDSTAIETAVSTSTGSKLPLVDAIVGLAKMRTFALNYQPDAIVSVQGRQGRAQRQLGSF